jgi:adenosine deaminase
LQDFLDIYYQGMSVLQKQQDFHDLAWAYLQRCKAQNIVHVEIFFDPQGHTARGVAFDTAMHGLLGALHQAELELGISHRLIMCFLRHLDEADAVATLELALPWRKDIHGVGLDSSERDHPPSGFQRVFARAAELGWHRVAHAGEEGPPEYVIEALDLLQVERIDHGNRAMEDPDLVQRLVESGIPLTVCPLSNQRLAVVPDLAKHPIRDMLRSGLRPCINSDDPAYFGGYLEENFAALIEAVDLTREEMLQLVINGFEASFLPESIIAEHVAAVRAVT